MSRRRRLGVSPLRSGSKVAEAAFAYPSIGLMRRLLANNEIIRTNTRADYSVGRGHILPAAAVSEGLHRTRRRDQHQWRPPLRARSQRASAFFTKLATRVVIPTVTGLARSSPSTPRPLVAPGGPTKENSTGKSKRPSWPPDATTC